MFTIGHLEVNLWGMVGSFVNSTVHGAGLALGAVAVLIALSVI